jgi:fructose-1,6-bisphosphatase/inositol monophosphatase family enzyme
MTIFTLAETLDLAEILAEAARLEVMPRFRRLSAGDIRAKSGPLDLVTEADEAAERRIGTALQARFPGCLVVGEEGCAADPALLRSLVGADLAFVVDPVDGTSNFAWGLPLFATMAAVVMRGETVASVIHDPVGRDHAIALRGEGAFTLHEDGHRVDLRAAGPVGVAEMVGGVSWRAMPAAMGARVTANLPGVAASFGYRCAGHEYRLLAAGAAHFLVYWRLLPWDHAPGVLLHREAGGYAGMLDGSPYSANIWEGGLICAPDQQSWLNLKDILFQM